MKKLLDYSQEHRARLIADIGVGYRYAFWSVGLARVQTALSDLSDLEAALSRLARTIYDFTPGENLSAEQCHILKPWRNHLYSDRHDLLPAADDLREFIMVAGNLVEPFPDVAGMPLGAGDALAAASELLNNGDPEMARRTLSDFSASAMRGMHSFGGRVLADHIALSTAKTQIEAAQAQLDLARSAAEAAVQYKFIRPWVQSELSAAQFDRLEASLADRSPEVLKSMTLAMTLDVTNNFPEAVIAKTKLLKSAVGFNNGYGITFDPE